MIANSTGGRKYIEWSIKSELHNVCVWFIHLYSMKIILVIK